VKKYYTLVFINCVILATFFLTQKPTVKHVKQQSEDHYRDARFKLCQELIMNQDRYDFYAQTLHFDGFMDGFRRISKEKYKENEDQIKIHCLSSDTKKYGYLGAHFLLDIKDLFNCWEF